MTGRLRVWWDMRIVIGPAMTPKTRRFISSFHVSQCSCHTLNPDDVGFNQGRGKISRPAKPDGGISGPMKKELTWRKRITRA